jgi:hypothetical protein
MGGASDSTIRLPEPVAIRSTIGRGRNFCLNARPGRRLLAEQSAELPRRFGRRSVPLVEDPESDVSDLVADRHIAAARLDGLVDLDCKRARRAKSRLARSGARPLEALREIGSVVELERDAPDGDGRHGEEPSTRTRGVAFAP